MTATTIISSTRVKPRSWRWDIRSMAYCGLSERAGATSFAAHSGLLLARREQVRGQDGAVAELLRNGVERLVEALALLPVSVEEPQLRRLRSQIARVHAGQADGALLHLRQQARGDPVDLGAVVGRRRQRLLPRLD